jgi:hypothetical protein
VRVVCECGACREIQPQALARLVGWKITLKKTRAADALLEVVAVTRPRPRGVPKNPHYLVFSE